MGEVEPPTYRVEVVISGSEQPQLLCVLEMFNTIGPLLDDGGIHYRSCGMHCSYYVGHPKPGH